MKSLIWMVCALALSAVTGGASLYTADNSKEINRIRAAKEVFQELMETPDRAIPRELLESAKCIAIIPGQRKAGFIVATEYGKGLAVCRTEHGWSGPVFLTIAGGAFGPQIGGTSTDVVMIFRNRDGFQKLLSDKFKIGADATAGAGPAARRQMLKCTPRFTYSRRFRFFQRRVSWRRRSGVTPKEKRPKRTGGECGAVSRNARRNVAGRS